MKVLAATKGDFQLVDFNNGGQVLQAHRPSVIVSTDFIQGRIGLNQVSILGEVNDEATDEEFVATLAEYEGDEEKAVEAFLAGYLPAGAEAAGSEAKGKKAPAKKD